MFFPQEQAIFQSIWIIDNSTEKVDISKINDALWLIFELN